MLTICAQLALFVIGAAGKFNLASEVSETGKADSAVHDLGFGQAMSWTDTDKRPEGHSLTFKEALTGVAHGIFIKVGVPDWAMGATKTTRTVRLAFEELDVSPLEVV
jgi:hypothetical protein